MHPRKLGLWIDHREAILVSLQDGDVRVETVRSTVRQHRRAKGGSRSKVLYGPQDVMSESKYLRKHKQQLKRFYQEVLDKMKDVSSALVIGPGAARSELLAELDGSTAHRNVSTETRAAERMTQPQLIALVKEHFGE